MVAASGGGKRITQDEFTDKAWQAIIAAPETAKQVRVCHSPEGCDCRPGSLLLHGLFKGSFPKPRSSEDAWRCGAPPWVSDLSVACLHACLPSLSSAARSSSRRSSMPSAGRPLHAPHAFAPARPAGSGEAGIWQRVPSAGSSSTLACAAAVRRRASR